MSTDLQPHDATDDYAVILAKLADLSRDLLLTFRLEAGKLMLDSYFGGSAHAYRDQNPYKVASFNAFIKTCKAELADYGLGDQLLAQCIRARIAWDSLPPPVRERLRYSHVVALAGVEEPTMRARLAMDATTQQWSVGQLKDAIARADDGRYYDTDPQLPGTQPPPAPPLVQRPYQAGRLATQLHKAGKDLQQWQAAWATVDAARLRGAQRQRVAEGLAALKEQVAKVEALLAGTLGE